MYRLYVSMSYENVIDQTAGVPQPPSLALVLIHFLRVLFTLKAPWQRRAPKRKERRIVIRALKLLKFDRSFMISFLWYSTVLYNSATSLVRMHRILQSWTAKDKFIM